MIRAALLFPLLLVVFAPTAAAAADAQSLLQLNDYVGVDYPEAVADGSVINAAEYAEMKEFSARVLDLLREMDADASLLDQALRVQTLISELADPPAVLAATNTLRDGILAAYPLALVPLSAPDLRRAATLYDSQCAACHGASGHGDGPAAAGLEPAPTDFHDRSRAMQRSLYGLYSTITLGVEGTAMSSFSQLSDSDRWALAFHVGGFAVSADERAAPPPAIDSAAVLPDLRALASTTPAELGARLGDDAAAYAMSVRRHPQRLFTSMGSPLAVAREKTALAVYAFAGGDRAAAYTAALAAYLDGFELIESGLSAVDDELMHRVEADMFAMRDIINDDTATLADVETGAARVVAGLQEAGRALEESELSAGVVFTSSLVILLREGLEAILIVAAFAAFLIKTGRREALTYLHAGWLSALALGVVTWAVSTWLLTISGATREITEGLTALLAAVILFYVGFWLHGKLQAQRWHEFLQSHVGKALESGTLWTLMLVSFLAVYREVFETVLFYQALWAQTGGAGQSMILGGAVTATLLLTVIAWLVFRLGMRLPLNQFFAASAAVMIVLAVIFAGKGVAALQEAGALPSAPSPFLPRIEMLGIYPNWQSIGLQIALSLLAVSLLWRGRRAAPSASA
jgi:high-affinity iron transporter